MPEYKLWWTPKCGDDGRGIVAEDGSVITWPEAEMTHCDRAETLGLTVGWVEFYIRFDYSDGKPILSRYALEDEHIELVLAVMPTLRPPISYQRKESR